MRKNSVPDYTANLLRPDFYQSVAKVLQSARSNAYRAVNFAMVEAYWQIGRMIVEEEQQGKERAEYGTALIQSLSLRLTMEFGKGFSETSLWNFRKFYLTFSDAQEILSAPRRESDGLLNSEKVNANLSFKHGNGESQIATILRPELTWTHYKLLMRVENPKARHYYLAEAADQNWSVRALERQINSLYYERILASRDRKPVVDEMLQKTTALAPQPQDFIKDPYVLEFQ